MKMNPRNRGGFTLVELLVVIAIIAALAGLTAPMVIRQRKKADQTTAVNNAHQVGIAMFEFEAEYGSFPDGTTGAAVNLNIGSSGLQAPTTITNANDAFRVLLASGISSSEEMFFCKTAYSTVKPDNIITTATDALKKGDVGFAYVMGSGSKAFSASGNSGRVLICAPVKYASTFTNKKFDKGPYDSKAVVLKMDNSVTSLVVNNDGDAVLGGTNKVFDEGPNTVWGDGVTLDVKDPDPK